eukprot:g11138.t1
MDDNSSRSSLSLTSKYTRGSLLLASKNDESEDSAGQHFDEMLGSDHKQTIAAISHLAAYMGRTGKGINHIFKDLDSSGDGKLSHHELERALVELDISITTTQAHALVNFMDSDGDGEIDVKELDSTIRLYKRRKRAGQLGTWHGNLSAQQDPVFPNWLIGRDDFQQVFTRQGKKGLFSAEAGTYGVPEVESALRKQPEDRLHRDVQVIINWLGQQDSLRSLGAKRLMEVTNVVEYQELKPDEQLFAEGDDSEAFYMILSGHVVVLVKKCKVAVLGPGETFGELGLQNLEKRTATVKADKSGAVLVTMRTSDYRHILSRFLMDKMQLKVVALTQDVQVCVVSRSNAFLYLTSGELDQLHSRTQELYRYAGDTNTSYYKAVKGWQDASRMKNEAFDDRKVSSSGLRL